MDVVPRYRFERLVADALDDLPDELLAVLDNVVVVVEDRHADEPDLLGLYDGVPLLAQVPLLPLLREGGDEGKPIAAVAPDSEAGRVFQALAERVAVELKPKKIFRRELTIH